MGLVSAVLDGSLVGSHLYRWQQVLLLLKVSKRYSLTVRVLKRYGIRIVVIIVSDFDFIGILAG